MDIKIAMCCHKPCNFIPPLCIPVQGGAALNSPITGMLQDNAEDNISDKNREYCELTVLYHAWKSFSADYIGLCHYRRFFCFDESVKRPYLAVKKLSAKKQARYLGDPQRLCSVISSYDVIVPRAEDMGISAEQYYITSEHHFKEDLSLFLELLKERCPQLAASADEYMSQSRQYFCNMAIMKKQLLDEYCGILFPLLEEFDSRKHLHGYFQGDRTDGYLGEYFLGIYVTHLKKTDAKIKEISRLDVDCPTKKIALYHLLPPESRRRFRVKSLVGKLKAKG